MDGGAKGRAGANDLEEGICAILVVKGAKNILEIAVLVAKLFITERASVSIASASGDRRITPEKVIHGVYGVLSTGAKNQGPRPLIAMTIGSLWRTWDRIDVGVVGLSLKKVPLFIRPSS